MSDGPVPAVVETPDKPLTFVTFAPPAASSLTLDSGSDTGTSNSDLVTSDTTPTIGFTIEVGASLTIDWDDGNGPVSIGNATGAAQTITLLSPYATDGDKEITVTATNGGGEVTTRTLTVTIDTAAELGGPTSLVRGPIFTDGLSPLTGFALYGGDIDADTGYSVSGLGDVNGDGIEDYAIGVPNGDGSDPGSGVVYVIYGSDQSPIFDITLASLTQDQGFRIIGDTDGDRFGTSITGLGDFNGDGINDIAVGASTDNSGGGNTGGAYVIYGVAGTRGDVDATFLTPDLGMTIRGTDTLDLFGVSISGAGDFNDDGLADIIIGAHLAEPSGGASNGSAYVIYGQSGNTTEFIDTATMTDDQGFELYSDSPGSLLGWSVSGNGDFDGDDIDDVVIGSLSSSFATIVLGGSGRTSGDTGTLSGSVTVINSNSGQFAYDVAVLGDVNEDGFDDIAFANVSSGDVQVLYGRAVAGALTLDLNSLAATDGFVIEAGALFGSSVSSAGDVNGDGIDDILIGAPNGSATEFDINAPNGTGVAYVVYGQAGATRTDLDPRDLNPDDGFAISGEGWQDTFGFSVSAAGDINNDGFDDLMIGAPENDGVVDGGGAAYILYGGSSTPTQPGLIDLVQESDTGGDNTDNLTNETLPTIALTTELGAAIEIDWDNGAGFESVGTGTGLTQLFVQGNPIDGPIYATDGTRTITVRITDVAGNVTTQTLDIDIALTDSAPTGTVTVEGDRVVGATLTADLSGINDPDILYETSVTYQWLRNGGVIDGANDATYTLTSGDVDALISVRISYLDGFNSAYLQTSSAVFINAGLAVQVGTENADTLQGSSGNDSLVGLGGDDVLIGTAGDDTAVGDEGSDTIWAGTGNDSSLGGSGNDVVGSGQGDDTARGGSGNDDLWGEAGADLLVGGSGDDQLGASSGADMLIGGSGDDRMWNGTGDDSAAGGQGNDLIASFTGDDTANGGSGSDTLWGGDGNDVLSGGADDDFVYGGADDDMVFGGTGADQLVGNDGADTVDGGSGNDSLFGNAGGDSLFGGDGDDSITAGIGSDVAYGGDGNDLLQLGDQNDTAGGGVGNDTLQGGAQNDSLFGGSGADELSGGADDDWLHGGTWGDTLNGGTGNDTLIGAWGNDLLQGGEDGDSLTGGVGDDTLTGGAGIDTIVFGLGDGADRWTDYSADDFIELDSALWSGTLTADQVVTTFGSDSAGDFVLDFGSGDTLTLEGQAGIANLANDILIV